MVSLNGWCVTHDAVDKEHLVEAQQDIVSVNPDRF